LCIFEAMKQLIRSHKENYGKTYGVLVIIALVYFILVGIAWFGAFLYLGKFVIEAFTLTLIFTVQLFLRNKIVNLVLGILAMFFSIWQLMDSVKLYPQINNPMYKNIFIINIIVFSVGIILAGILIFSFLYAFLQKEKASS
jgi:hypothetical protein